MKIIKYIKKLINLMKRGYVNGKLKYLSNRNVDVSACQLDDVPLEITEKALEMFCLTFGVPEEQKYCIKLDDNLKDIYTSFNYLFCDCLEFEELYAFFNETIMPAQITMKEFEKIETICDLILTLNYYLKIR